MKNKNNLNDFLKNLENNNADVCFDPIYDQIRYARRSDDHELSHGVWVKPLKESQWSEVEKLCSMILKTRSKDLQVAVWLWEAWINLYESGFYDGLNLLSQIILNFNYYPTEQTHRLNILEWADNNLSVYLIQKNIAINEKKEILIILNQLKDYNFPKIKHYLLLEKSHNLPVDQESQKETQDISREKNVEIMTIDTAFEVIENIRLFLHTQSPQSLAPLLLDIVLSWKNKTLTEIIEEIENNKSCHQKVMHFLYKKTN